MILEHAEVNDETRNKNNEEDGKDKTVDRNNSKSKDMENPTSFDTSMITATSVIY